MMKNKFMSIEVVRQKGTPESCAGTIIFDKEIPINKKYHCELCKKKPKIFVVDIDEQATLKFCSSAHLYKFFKGE
jgi:hypothetical protein